MYANPEVYRLNKITLINILWSTHKTKENIKRQESTDYHR